MTRRPRIISILARFMIIGGIGALFFFIPYLFQSWDSRYLFGEFRFYFPSLNIYVPDEFTGVLSVILLGINYLMVPLISIIFGLALWFYRKWAWFLSISFLFFTLSALLILLASLWGNLSFIFGIIGIVLNCLVIFCLTRPVVIQYFNLEEIVWEKTIMQLIGIFFIFVFLSFLSNVFKLQSHPLDF